MPHWSYVPGSNCGLGAEGDNRASRTGKGRVVPLVAKENQRPARQQSPSRQQAPAQRSVRGSEVALAALARLGCTSLPGQPHANCHAAHAPQAAGEAQPSMEGPPAAQADHMGEGKSM
jgi:hypothetical protein